MSPATLLLIIRVLMALVLYSFLTLALSILWRDLRAAALGDGQAPEAYLLVLEGAQDGERLPLRQTADVGRVGGNVVRLRDETVSAKHARLSFHGGQWWLEDLASRNGTDVNGLPVEQPLVVTYGDEIRFGHVRVRLEAGRIEGEPLATDQLETIPPKAPVDA